MLRLAALILVLAPATAAQEHGLSGPYPAGWRDVAFTANGTDYTGRVYYPALAAGEDAAPDVASGPYPLLSHTHGQAGHPDEYDLLLEHVASWGWVVGAVQTYGNAPVFAADTKAMLKWVDEESGAAESFLAGMVSQEHEWSSMGHSWGGGCQQFLIKQQPKIRNVIALQPAFFPGSVDDLEVFEGSLLVITGNMDQNTPTNENGAPYYLTAEAARRRAFVKVVGMAHYGPVDDPPGLDQGTLPHEEQHELHRRIVVSFLLSEVKGIEDPWAEFNGETAEIDPLKGRAACFDPPLWVGPSATVGDTLRLGAIGQPFEPLLLMAAARPGAMATDFGVFGLDPASTVFLHHAAAPERGVVELLLPLPRAAMAGAPIWFQAFAYGDGFAQLSRTARWSLE